MDLEVRTVSACPSCAIAERNPLSGEFHSGCKECSARMMADGMPFFRSAARGRMVPEYIAALRSVWGEDYLAGHKRVRAWDDRICQARAREAV